ncbi:MAG: OmpW family protein [Piscinibacter sp.]|nr:OmpW family protein [Piscinibacter sp.]
MTSKTFRRSALVVALAAGLGAPCLAQAQSGPWLVRVHALSLDSANKDETGNDLSVNNKVFPEVDISYFFTPNIAAELVLTYPQKHDVKSGGTQIGTLKHLPPTLSAQYHFTDLGAFKPYVGAGINYTRFSSVNILDGAATIDKNSVGLAVGAGFDYEFSKGMVFNVDIKKVQIRTDVSVGGTNLGQFKVDPLLVGVGVGWRF